MSNMTQLLVTGRLTKEGYEVILCGIPVYLSKLRFYLILELIWAFYLIPYGRLANELSFVIENDDERGCNLVRHVRGALRRPDAILNRKKAYALAKWIGEPIILEAIRALPEIDYRIMRRVDEALERMPQGCHPPDICAGGEKALS